MRIKRITRAVSVVMLLALLISMFPLIGAAGIVSAETAAATETTAPEPELVEETEAAVTEAAAEPPSVPLPEEPADPEPEPETEAPTEPATDPIEINPFDDPSFLQREAEKFMKDYDPTAKSDVVNPQAASNATMSLAGRFYIYGIGGDSIKRMTYNGNLYKVYCLHRTKNSGNNVPYTSDTSTWGLGTYSSDIMAAVGKLLAIANTMFPNPTYSDELAIQLLVWELAEKTTAGPYSLTKKYVGYFDDVWGFQTYANGTWTPANDELSNLTSAKQHFNSLATAFNATNNAPALPSFASASQGEAQTYELSYNSTTQKYEVTLTDTNNVLSNYTVTCDNSDVVITTVNANTIKISASNPDAFNDAVIKTVGNTYEYSYNNSNYVGFIPSNTSTYQCCAALIHNIRLSFKTGYLKIRASLFSVSLKKTTQASESVLACIQDNPLYSLQGAVYEIHQGSKTGPVTETLTTNANGEAVGTRKYELGTTLYAVETAAPSGYLLNDTSVSLTVSSGSNVFNVSDTPTFDPNVLEIKKTGLTGEYIAGAVFKAEFYASTWANPDRLLRTWYLQSDESGYVAFDDAHIAAGYTSDPLFKPYNAPQFPLGCVVVREIKAANGYVLPSGNTGVVFIFIKQRDADRSAYAYWGDGAANPLNTANPKGIYTVENDADPSQLTAVNTEAYGVPFFLKKTDPSGVPLEGAVFQVDYYRAAWFDQTKLERSWYFCTDVSGFFTLDSAYLAEGYTSDELFSADEIPVGVMAVREVAAPTGFQLNDFCGAWRIKQAESGSSAVVSYWADSDCETPTSSYGDAAYVLDAEPDQLYVEDIPTSRLELIKTSDDGNVNNISFTVEEYEPEGDIGWWTKGAYQTDADGKIDLDLKYGYRYRVTETVPEDYVSENRVQEFTAQLGTNTLTFVNHPVAKLEIVKTSSDGKVAGISFKVEVQNSRRWTVLGTYVSDGEGKILVEDLEAGKTLRITEIVPENYICTSDNPQTITLVKGMNSVSFTNRLIRGSLRIVKVDKATQTPLEGAGFMLYTSDGSVISSGYTDEKGVLAFADLPYGDYYYQEFQAPAGFTLDEVQYSFSISDDGVEIVHQRENQPKEGSISIYKTNEDGRQLPGVEFLLEYSVDGGTTWQPIQFRGVGSDVQAGFTTSPHLSNGKLTTGRNGTVTFSGLCIDTQLGVVQYRITETKTVDGYSLLPGYAFEGSLSEDSRTEASFTVVNHLAFKLPMTGGSGFIGWLIALGLCVLGFAVLLLMLPRKREVEN